MSKTGKFMRKLREINEANGISIAALWPILVCIIIIIIIIIIITSDAL